MSQTRTYDLAETWWRGGSIEVKCVLDDAHFKIVKIPEQFIRKGGDNTLAFVHHVIQLLYVERGELRSPCGGALDLSEEPIESSQYIFSSIEENLMRLTPTRGPEGKSPLPKPASSVSESTYSNSKHTTSRSGQVSFFGRLTSS